MSEASSDEALMLAYRDGREEAFELLYRRWRGKLYRYLLHQCNQAAVADEVFQDVWLRVVNARFSYEVTAKFSTWLFRIAHNRLIDHFRAQKGTVSLDDDEQTFIEMAAPEHETPARLLDRKQVAERIVKQLQALPDEQREVFLMAEEGGMTLEEIANATGVGREIVKSRLRYALGKLRQGLGDLL